MPVGDPSLSYVSSTMDLGDSDSYPFFSSARTRQQQMMTRRYFATTTTTPPTLPTEVDSVLKSTTENPSSGTATKQNEEHENNDNNNNNKNADSHQPPSASSFRETVRARYDAKRDEYRCRAEDYRASARTHYAEFKEHPGQSAREGAITIKGMIQRYGPVFVGTYATVYFSTLALLFAGVETGALDPVALFQWLGQENGTESTVQLVVDFMENHSFTRPYAHVIEKNPSVANLAVAWIAVKFTEPFRLALSAALTPRVARYFGYSKVEKKEGAEASVDEKKPSSLRDEKKL